MFCMSLGGVCSFKFNARKNKDWRNKSGYFFLRKKACPLAHAQGIYHRSIDTNIDWQFNCLETRKKIRFFS